MPQRIDRSTMSSLSGAAQSQLTGTMQYLGLIDGYGNPLPALREYVRTEGAERQAVLRDILTQSYGFLLGEWAEGFDLSSATQSQFDGKFKTTGVSGDTLRKAQTFFLAAAQAAGIPISPYIKANRKPMESGTSRPRTGTGTRTRRKPNGRASGGAAADSQGGSAKDPPPPPPPAASAALSLQELLVQKFPAFDPQWPPEAQAKWFDAFTRMWDQVNQTEAEDEDIES